MFPVLTRVKCCAFAASVHTRPRAVWVAAVSLCTDVINSVFTYHSSHIIQCVMYCDLFISNFVELWTKDSLFSTWFWDSWMFTRGRMKLGPRLTALRNTNSGRATDFSGRSQSLKLLGNKPP